MPQVLLKNGSTFWYPASWKLEELEERVRLQGPEADFIVHFLVLASIEEVEKQAWQQVSPNFDLKISQQFSLPSAWLGGFWENGLQLIYDVPLSEAKTVMALVRTYQNQAYISLIEATNAALQRRGAELGQMMESWKPSGAEVENLNEREAKTWDAVETSDFDHFIQSNMEKFKIPGCAVAIVQKNGKMIFSKGYGVKKLGATDPVTVNTPFMIGSTTKALTTFMMGAVMDQKKISWDTPVTDVLTTFRLGDEALTQQLSARLTVSASTGMPRRDFDFIFNYSDITPEDRLKQMKEMKPTTKLGETFQYSNFLFMTGGYMAALAYTPTLPLQEAYANAMKTLVIEPLGMKQTVLTASEATALGASFPHSLDINGEPTEIPLNIEQSCSSIAPSGALWSSVQDMSQYLLAELNQGVRGQKRVISEENLCERRKPGIKMGDKSSYGLGLIVGREQGLQIISHGGGTMGFATDLFFYPEKGIGVVVMANSRYGHSFISGIKQKFLELTFGAKLQADEIINVSISQQTEMLRKVKQDVSLENERLVWIKEFIGEYSNPHLGDAHIVQTQNGFEMLCKEWKSRLGSEIDQNGKRYLVLVDPPFPGLLKLQAQNNGELMLDAGQEQYQFKKKELIIDDKYPSILIAKKQYDLSCKGDDKQDKDKAYENLSSKHRL